MIHENIIESLYLLINITRSYIKSMSQNSKWWREWMLFCASHWLSQLIEEWNFCSLTTQFSGPFQLKKVTNDSFQLSEGSFLNRKFSNIRRSLPLRLDIMLRRIKWNETKMLKIFTMRGLIEKLNCRRLKLEDSSLLQIYSRWYLFLHF